MPYMYALHACLACMPYMHALYACLICMPYMHALYAYMPYDADRVAQLAHLLWRFIRALFNHLLPRAAPRRAKSALLLRASPVTLRYNKNPRI